MRILILGGTRFVGRAAVEAALAAGHTVTLFNRGRTEPELFAGRSGVDFIRGDRAEIGPDTFAGQVWDVAVDVAAYHPSVVRRSVAALADRVQRYLYVSTISVYADPGATLEVSAVAQLDPGDEDDTDNATYGARKAACESEVRKAFGDRATIVRPGLIVGPFDPTDRFGYWPRRIAEGGRVLAPGDPGDPVQWIDVRDLAAFMVRLLEDDIAGTFNAVGPTTTFADLLASCRRNTAADVEITWVPANELRAAGLHEGMGIPLWIDEPEWHAFNRVDASSAVAAGLRSRDVDDTVGAALASPRPAVLSTFDRRLEAATLDGHDRRRRTTDGADK